MRRLLIFSLLGPLLGFVTGFWVMRPIMAGLLGDPLDIDWHQIVLMPLAYALGIVPAFLTGLFDEFGDRRSFRRRVLWTTLFGFTISFLPLATALAAGFIRGPWILLWGLIGAIPAAICSWLAGKPVSPAPRGRAAA